MEATARRNLKSNSVIDALPIGRCVAAISKEYGVKRKKRIRTK